MRGSAAGSLVNLKLSRNVNAWPGTADECVRRGAYPPPDERSCIHAEQQPAEGRKRRAVGGMEHGQE